MGDVYITAGSGAGATPPASTTQTGGPAAPAMTTNFDRTVTALVSRTILQNLRSVARWLVPGAYVEGTIVPGTNLIRHIAYGDLAPSLSLIPIEGEPPDEVPLSIGWDEYSATQKGRLIGITDVALKLSPHELMAIAAEKIAYDAMMTVDRSIAAAVAAGTGITLPALTVATGLTAADVRKWVAEMKNANIPPFPDGYYLCMVHPDALFDLQSDTAIGGWIEASKYAAPEQLLTGEIGRMYGVRFIESTIGTVNRTGTDTYLTVVFGQDYFAFGDIQTIETYMVRPGGDHADPLAQKALVGYKGMWGAKTIESASLLSTAAAPKYAKLSHVGTINRT